MEKSHVRRDGTLRRRVARRERRKRRERRRRSDKPAGDVRRRDGAV